MKLHSIQALRGFAALAVAMTHLVTYEREAIKENGFTEQSLAGGLWENGFAGVDLFFVISGFIMIYVTANRTHSIKSAADFLLARAARIFPLWWLFVAVMAVIFLIVHNVPYHPVEYAKTDTGVTAYVLKSVFLIPQEGLPILGVGWTLIHEMYFYLVFALFLCLPKRFLPLLLLVWLAVIAISYVAGLTNTYPGTLLHVATYPMTAEFIAGALAGLAYLKVKQRYSFTLALLSALAFLSAMVFFQNSTADELGMWATLKWGRVIFFGIPAVVLIYTLTNLEREQRLKIPKWMLRLGDISFSLYLCHTIIIILTKRAFSEAAYYSGQIGMPDPITNCFLIGAPGPVDNILFALVCLGVSVVVANIAYEKFEKPSLEWLARIRKDAIGPINRA